MVKENSKGLIKGASWKSSTIRVFCGWEPCKIIPFWRHSACSKLKYDMGYCGELCCGTETGRQNGGGFGQIDDVHTFTFSNENESINSLFFPPLPSASGEALSFHNKLLATTCVLISLAANKVMTQRCYLTRLSTVKETKVYYWNAMKDEKNWT